ncbi:MAG: hypothetical protein LAP86_03620 [Acidobacteriia bacterium]|nr:hypothetical protein [Terriglobia bacterium]
MPTELYAGTLADFNDSMAQAIEDALTALMGPLPSVPPKVVHDRRALFIAIANGVIKHLAEKQAALKIDFDVGLDHITTNPVIQVRS